MPGSKWARDFVWAQLGLTPPPEGDDKAAAQSRHAHELLIREHIATTLVEAWTAQLAQDSPPLWSPTLEAAFLAKRPWLQLCCPGCAQRYEVDLRKIVRPKDFPILALRAAMVCESMCRGQAQPPRILGLAQAPYDRRRVTSDGAQP